MDKKSKGIITVLSVFLLGFFIIIVGLLYHISNMNSNVTNCIDQTELPESTQEESALERITITRIDNSTNETIQTYNITKKEDIDLLLNAKNNIHILEENEQVKLGIATDVIIRYEDDNFIKMGLIEKQYCMYGNERDNTEQMASMPEGLFEFVNSIVNK